MHGENVHEVELPKDPVIVVGGGELVARELAAREHHPAAETTAAPSRTRLDRGRTWSTKQLLRVIKIDRVDVAAILCNQIYTNQFTDQFNGFRFDVNNWGWAIVLEKDDFVEVRFIFVYPEFRRQGNFKRLIDSLKTREKKIIVCSNKPIMVRSLISLGFKLDGKSMNEKELRYVINL